jgi:hypothetical protein
MLGRAERRAHHVRGGAREIRIAIHRVVDQQMAGEHFAEDALAFVARARDGLECLARGDVHEVDRNLEHLGNADGAVGGFAFHFGRPRQRMTLGSCDAALEDFILQLEHQVAILGVRRHDGAERQRRGEAVHQRFVVAHDGVLVRHEMLEAVDAVLAHQRAHVLAHAVVPPGDGDVK